MNSTGSHWKLQENIFLSGFSYLVCGGLQYEPKKLNDALNPDEHTALGCDGMLDTWPGTFRFPNHIEDNGCVLFNAMGFELLSKFPVLSSHFESSVERKGLLSHHHSHTEKCFTLSKLKVMLLLPLPH